MVVAQDTDSSRLDVEVGPCSMPVSHIMSTDRAGGTYQGKEGTQPSAR